MSKLRSNEIIGNKFGESREKVRRYIRLTYLISELLELVDNSVTKDPRYNLTLGITSAVEISYLSESEQLLLYDLILINEATPSYAQARKLRELSKKKLIDFNSVERIIIQMKGNQNEKITFNKKKIEKVIPRRLLNKDKRYIEDYIIEAIKYYEKYKKYFNG